MMHFPFHRLKPRAKHVKPNDSNSKAVRVQIKKLRVLDKIQIFGDLNWWLL